MSAAISETARSSSTTMPGGPYPEAGQVLVRQWPAGSAASDCIAAQKARPIAWSKKWQIFSAPEKPMEPCLSRDVVFFFFFLFSARSSALRDHRLWGPATQAQGAGENGGGHAGCSMPGALSDAAGPQGIGYSNDKYRRAIWPEKDCCPAEALLLGKSPNGLASSGTAALDTGALGVGRFHAVAKANVQGAGRMGGAAG